jgi:hypothetical protein
LGTAQAPLLNRSPNQEISLMKTPHTVPTLQQALKLPHLFTRSLQDEMGASLKQAEGPKRKLPPLRQAIRSVQKIQALRVVRKKRLARKATKNQ